MPACVFILQLCLNLCDPINYSLPGSSVHGVLQASGLPSPSPGDLPDPGIEPRSPAWQADSLPTELSGKPTQSYDGCAINCTYFKRTTVEHVRVLTCMHTIEALTPSQSALAVVTTNHGQSGLNDGGGG